MFLALSSRMFEQRTGYELELDAMAALLADIGYNGIELRRRQLNESATPATIARVRATLGRRKVGCVCLTAAGLENDSAVDDATRLLAVALALDCRLVRVQLVRDSEIPFAQEFADRAADRGLRVMSQIHSGTLFPNVQMALETLGKIGRDSFGVAFEPSQLMFEGLDHGEAAVRALGSRLFACFLEAFKPAAAGSEAPGAIMIAGRPWLPALPGEPGTADLVSLFRGLQAIGFTGPVVVSCARNAAVPSRELARKWHDEVRQAAAQAGLV